VISIWCFGTVLHQSREMFEMLGHYCEQQYAVYVGELLVLTAAIATCLVKQEV
jgi:hypothetical protein